MLLIIFFNESIWKLLYVNRANFEWFQVNVRVTTMDAELEFAIQSSTTGKQLFDQVWCLDHGSGHTFWIMILL